MKRFDKIIMFSILLILVSFVAANVVLLLQGTLSNGKIFYGKASNGMISGRESTDEIPLYGMLSGIMGFLGIQQQGRPYRVEVVRIAREIEQDGLGQVDLSQYTYVINVEQYHGDDGAFFEDVDSEYLIRQVDGQLYRFDYIYVPMSGQRPVIIIINVILGILSLSMLALLFFFRQKLLKPFEALSDVPYQLSRGNLTMPVQENKSRFFGKFIWGVDLLREKIEQQKERELALQRDKKTLLLSISHDIKTPLSAIKLYAKALSRGLYGDTDKQTEIAENINTKADEIEGFVSQIIKASSEDFLNLEVAQGEFYLSELVDSILAYYRDKLELIKLPFSVGEYDDCLLKGDLDRGIEVLQNIMENAVKYGDGCRIELEFSQEEDCRIVTVKNSGCNLPEGELPHIFDSFWRGSNAGNQKGSGLGLYICRQLMHQMDGEVFAQKLEGCMCVSVVFRQAG